MGKRLFQLNEVGQVNEKDYLLIDGEGYLESKKVKLENIGLEKFNTEKFYNKDDVDYNFVAKEPNKGLSTNDFTNEDKDKLDTLAEMQNRILAYISYQSLGNEIKITHCNTDIEGDHIIPELIEGLPVTKIGAQAFYKCGNLTGLIIPNTVKEIQAGAFAECINLKNIALSENLEGYIKDAVFASCHSLESIKIPSNIEHIGNQAFLGCGLKNITFEGKINTIGNEAFRDANSITSISLPISLTSIGVKAFYELGSLVDVYYEGSEDQWEEISIDSDNDSLFEAIIHYNQRPATVDDVLKKQNTLVSGENIKTINGESILGSGNIEIQGGSVVDITIDQTYSPESENPQSGTAVAEALKAQYGDVVSLITTPRKYDTEGWEKRGAKGYYTDWSNVSNRGNLKVGQIGLLPGLNITNNEPVILVGEIKEITEYMVWLESITWIQLTGCKGNKGEDGKDGVDGTVSFDNLTDAQKASLKGDTGPRGPQGPQGPQGPAREATYHRFRDLQNVDDLKFELQKGHLYSFTVDNDDVNSAYIVDTNGKTIAGVAGKTLSGMKNGFIICADRCSGGGLTGELSILNPTAFVTDRWDWNDGYRNQYGPYYLRITTQDGIDIWEI